MPCLPGYEDTLTPIQDPLPQPQRADVLLTSINNSNLFVRRNYFHLPEVLHHSGLEHPVTTNKNKGCHGQYISHCFIGRKFKDGFNFQTVDHEIDKHCATHLSVFPEFSLLPRRTALGHRDVFGLRCKVCGICRSRAQGSERKLSVRVF